MVLYLRETALVFMRFDVKLVMRMVMRVLLLLAKGLR